MKSLPTIFWASLAMLVAMFASCTMTGPISAPVAAGAAAMVAVFDQLLASGVLTPDQHLSLVQSVTALNDGVKTATSNSVTPEQLGLTAGGLTAAVLGLIRTWRGPATKAENVTKAAQATVERTAPVTP